MLGFLEEGFNDAVDWVGDRVSDAGDLVDEGFFAAADAIGATFSAGLDVIGTSFETFGGAVSSFDQQFGISDTFGDASGALWDAVGDPMLTAFDDSGFFDVIEVASLTMVDIEYSDAGLSLDYGLEDVFGFGMTIGEEGISGDMDAMGTGVEASLGDDGFSVGGSIGLDWGPLPNADARVSVDGAGDFGADGRVEGYLPSPSGFSGGEVGGGYQETPEGFRVDGSFTVRHFAPSGTYAGAGVHVGYEEDAHGYRTNVGLHVEAGQLGGPEVRASIDYTESRQGDVETTGVSVSADVSAPGVEVSGGAGYTHIETPDGDYDVVSGRASVSTGGVTASGNATVTSGPDGITVEAEGDLDLGDDPLGNLKGLAESGGLDLPDGPGDLGLPDLPDLPDLPEVPGMHDIEGLARTAGLDPADLPDLPPVPGVPDVKALVHDALPDVPAPQDLLDTAMEHVVDQLPPLPEPAPPVEELLDTAASEATSALDDALAQATETIEDL